MKFGIFYEHQLPKPWTEGAEQKLAAQEPLEESKHRLWYRLPGDPCAVGEAMGRLPST